jgi:hypothetical protein
VFLNLGKLIKSSSKRLMITLKFFLWSKPWLNLQFVIVIGMKLFSWSNKKFHMKVNSSPFRNSSSVPFFSLEKKLKKSLNLLTNNLSWKEISKKKSSLIGRLLSFKSKLGKVLMPLVLLVVISLIFRKNLKNTLTNSIKWTPWSTLHLLR